VHSSFQIQTHYLVLPSLSLSLSLSDFDFDFDFSFDIAECSVGVFVLAFVVMSITTT
jgi:hypothetical protein